MSISLLFLGFLIGMRHALEADHVAAVASLVTDNSSLKNTLWQGAVWGIGHTITLFVFGSVALLSDSVIPENIAAALEFAVGIMLVLLGLDVLRRLYQNKIHFHSHQHEGGVQHFHAHSHKQHPIHSKQAHQHRHKPAFPKRALLVGLMHGMAGSAALIVLAMSYAITPINALFYIVLFGMGSILGMAVLSCVIAIPLRYSTSKLSQLYKGLHITVACVTLGLGGIIVTDYLQTVFS